jgi:protein-tyrosine phosphatase
MMQDQRPLWDTHSHVLPDLDDGPETIDDAIEIIAISAQRGVTGLVATPHSLSVLDAGGLAIINDRIGRLSALINERSLPVALVDGMEIRLMPDAAEKLTAGQYITINGTPTALIEFDYTNWANYSDQALFDIAVAGHEILLAHVERIVPLQEHPQRVIRYVERGYYSQITAASLTGAFGSAPKKTAEFLLAHGAIHVVASDTHSSHGLRQPWPMGIGERLEKLVGESAMQLLVYENPARIVNGKSPLPVEPRPPQRGRRFWPFGSLFDKA